jgi:hypothetical protein
MTGSAFVADPANECAAKAWYPQLGISGSIEASPPEQRLPLYLDGK